MVAKGHIVTQLKDTAEADSRLVIKPNRANEIIAVIGVAFLALVVATGITENDLHYSPAAGFVEGALWVFITLNAIYRVMKSLLKPKIYVFDRASHTFSIDGEPLGSLSDIKKIMINKKKVPWGYRYAVDIVHEYTMDTISIYYFKNSATNIAERISSFLDIPENQKQAE